MSSDFIPKTPEEFISYYEEKLKNELKVYNIQINKVGFLGFLLNVLGHTHYDLKNYYDSLFKESFVATAQSSENIHLHASTYGYYPSYAIPASISGNFEIDFNLLPTKQASVTKRELYLNNPGQLLKFESEGYHFCTKASYKIIQEDDQYKTIIISENDESIQYPSPTSVLTPPLMDVKQYEEQEFYFKSPSYPLNSFYSYYFEIKEGYISDLKVFVKENNSLDEEEYEITYVKYFETGSSKKVFLRKITQTKFLIELGSGMRGKWLPQAEIRILVNVTKAAAGNFLKLSQTTQKEPQQAILIDLDSSGNVVSTSNLDSSQIVLIKVDASENGKDPLDDIELRDAVIQYIQTRDNLISELDFYNIAEKYLTDFKFLFKKIHVYDNFFNIHRVLRDKYQKIVFSNNNYIEKSSFTNLYHPVFNIDGKDMISPFLYKYNSLMDWYDGYLLYDDLLVYLNSISLTDEVPPTYTVPPLYFNLIYEHNNSRTKIQLKSYQDISSLSFKITINQLNINEQNLTQIDVNTFEFIYTDNNGIIYNSIDIFLEASTTTIKVFYGKVNSIIQTYDISDVLSICNYEHNSIDYLIGIPLIDKDEFDNETEYYLNKINDFILGCKFPENRMISDIVQFRFLNSFIIKSPFLESSVKQKEDIILKVENWLNDVLSFENDPLTNPVNGDRVIIDSSPTGVFIGHENEIAEWNELPEITDITCNAASTLSGGEYFLINSKTVNYYVWYNINVSSSDPSPVGLTGIEVNIDSTDSADQVADKTASTINVLVDFNASNFNSDNVQIINYDLGNVTDASDNDTGFTVTVSQQGVDGHYIYTVPINYDGVLVSETPSRYYFENNLWNEFLIKLPLKLKVEIYINQNYLTSNNINLIEEKENLLFQLADLLQKNYTSTNIIYYNSQIIDFVHLERPYIKSVTVEVTDSNNIIIPNGIESIEDNLILDNLKTNKFNIVTYTPTFWHWDVDNIELIAIIDQE